tara:strand:+ start:518 stop:652 length:135 start_codon:yes stop_codon:yes gene_type:complete
MKSFNDFLAEGKKAKAKKKREPTIEVMPTVNDGQKGMVSKPDNS